MNEGHRANERHGGGRPARLVPVKCTSTTPFQVSIGGDPTPVEANRILGSTLFAVGEYGMALYAPPLPPICFKTTT